MHQLGKDVPPQIIRTQPVSARRRPQRRANTRERVAGSDLLGKKRRQHNQQREGKTYERQRLPKEALPQAAGKRA
jgi:hypothetical protein